MDEWWKDNFNFNKSNIGGAGTLLSVHYSLESEYNIWHWTKLEKSILDTIWWGRPVVFEQMNVPYVYNILVHWNFIN